VTDPRRYIAARLFATLLVATMSVPAEAQRSGYMPEIFEGVDMIEHLGDFIPLELSFRNEDGEAVPLSTYFDGRTPVVINMIYHNCPMLCNIMLNGFTESLREMAWVPGNEFRVLTVSFASDETPELAARQKESYLRTLDKPGAERGWHFLTGTEENIQALAASIGFQYKWVEEAQEYAHPAVLTFAGGDGKITRYLYGLTYSERNMRNALIEASEGRVGTTLDRVLLFCLIYDSSKQMYVIHPMNVMKLGGLLTLLILGSLLFLFWRREGSNLRHTAPSAA
jgi:protein SCO1